MLIVSMQWPGIDHSYWELIFSEFTDVFENPSPLPGRAIKHKINLLPDTVQTTKSYYRMSPVQLAEVRKQSDEYLVKGWIRPRVSPYGVPIF